MSRLYSFFFSRTTSQDLYREFGASDTSRLAKAEKLDEFFGRGKDVIYC